MTCPNCGSANADNSKFCWNCGTAFGGSSPQPPFNPPPATPPYQQPQYPPPVYQQQPPQGQSVASKIAIGCLIAVLIVILFFVSCTRACFGRRRLYRYYGVAIPLVVAPQSSEVR